MAVTVDVYGSCVSKDVFRYVSPGKYTFRRCVTQTPISTPKMPFVSGRCTSFAKERMAAWVSTREISEVARLIVLRA